MVNQLTMAIARAIKEQFPQTDIFTEQLEQGFESPCFFVLCISHKEHDRLDVRFLTEHTFCISYFPQKGNQELHFFVDYDFYMLKRKQPDEYMEVLNVYEKTRNGRK